MQQWVTHYNKVARYSSYFSYLTVFLFLKEAELAWHFFLPGLTSGYMYYGGVEDMPVKQTVASNNAVAHGLKAIGMWATDNMNSCISHEQQQLFAYKSSHLYSYLQTVYCTHRQCRMHASSEL